MEKFSEVLVQKRNMILTTMLVLAVLCAFLSLKVNVISDMTEYLPDDSSMKKGINIMKEEFGGLSSSSVIRLMSENIGEEDREALLDELSALEYADSVAYDPDSETYNKDGYSLFEVSSGYDFGTAEMDSLEKNISDLCEQYGLVYDTNSSGVGDIPSWLVAVALLILLAVLFVMCESWIEPFIFLAAIGIAIVINLGTNVFLSGISEITQSIAAILQLVLSMDYSIILINRYRQELAHEKSNAEAMEKAVVAAFMSITSSSLTTIVGLLALLFMSFKIGADLGIVLAKGVLISMVCIFTVLPALILMLDKAIRRTAKKTPSIKMNGLAAFCARCRYVFPCLLAVIFISVAVLKGNTLITYSMTTPSDIEDIFPKTNTIVVLYETADEEKIHGVSDEIEEYEGVRSVSSYYTILAKQYTPQELSEKLSSMTDDLAIEEWMLDFICYDYNGGEAGSMSMSGFISFIKTLTEENANLLSGFDLSSLEQLDTLALFADKEELSKERTAAEAAKVLGVDETVAESLFLLAGSETMTLTEFVQTAGKLTGLPGMSAQSEQLSLLEQIITDTENDKVYTPAELSALFSSVTDMLNEEMMTLVFKLYASQNTDDCGTISVGELFSYITSMAESEEFSSVFDEATKQLISDAKEQLDAGKQQLVGENYSMMAVTTTLEDCSDEAYAFLADLEGKLAESLSGNYYLIGSSPMGYEMSQSFASEFNKISVITAAAIFLVILISFRSVSVPVILVLVIQTAVYTTMVIIGLAGSGMYYLALLIVQSILMGATVDYGILFTSYYREGRKISGMSEALAIAYNGSIHTILTSGLIMVLVTWILGYAFPNPASGQICHIIALGVTCAMLLIVFILPGVLASFDRLVCGRETAGK